MSGAGCGTATGALGSESWDILVRSRECHDRGDILRGGWFSTCSTEAWAGDYFSPRTRTSWRSSGSLRKRCELAGCGCALLFDAQPLAFCRLARAGWRSTRVHAASDQHACETVEGASSRDRVRPSLSRALQVFPGGNRRLSTRSFATWSGTPSLPTSWSERNRGVGRVCAVDAKTRRFPSSRRGHCDAPPIGCNLSTNPKRKPKRPRCVAASIAVGPSAILTGSRTRPSDWGWNRRFGPVEGRI